MRILVVVNNLDTGGITSALANMVNSCPENDWFILPLKYDLSDKNIFRNASYESRHLLFDILLRSFSEVKKSKNPFAILLKILMSVMKIIIGQEKLVHLIAKLSKKTALYDVAISYNNDIWYENGNFLGGSNSFTAAKGRSRLKYAWIHAQPEFIGLTEERGIAVYHAFDKVVNVSYACEEHFVAIIPGLKDKCAVVYNFIDFIKLQSYLTRESPYVADDINLLTVARIENRAKRIDRIIPIAKKLKDNGFSFVWTVIGDGPDLEKTKMSVKRSDLEKEVRCIGKREAPFSYMQHADIFVLTSDFEAYPMVVCESLACQTPVVCTDFPAAHEMISDGIDGYVVEKNDEAFYRVLSDLLSSKDKLDKMKSHCNFDANGVAKSHLSQLLK